MSNLQSYNWEPGISKLPTNSISLTTHFLKQLQRPAFPCLLQQYSVTCYPTLHLKVSYMWGRFWVKTNKQKKKKKGSKHEKEAIEGT